LIRAAARQSLFLPCPGKTQSHISSTSTSTDQIRIYILLHVLLKPLGNQRTPNPKLSSSLELSSSSILSSTNLPPRFIATKKLYSKQILDTGEDTTRKGGKKKHQKKKKKKAENQASEIYLLFSSSHIFQEQKL
jgi:hypothetical protein